MLLILPLVLTDDIKFIGACSLQQVTKKDICFQLRTYITMTSKLVLIPTSILKKK
jgi:hypothetical protein